jgi:dTDP-glucose 4,6-dehydratase
MIDKSTFWQGKNVLVTGAGGFIGSHLVEKLAQSGAGVRAFVRYNSRGDPGLLSMLPKGILDKLEIIPGDLRDLQALLSASRDVEIIFHLGALIAIPYSYKHPAEVVESNVMGTMNVLLASRENRIERLVHTSSSEVYGSAVRVPIDESHPLQGQSPYSASKIGADKIAESFYCAYDLPVVTVRPFNTFGPRQSARAVIPSIIIQALNQNEVHLGNLEANRDFTYVSDTVDGFLCAGHTPSVEGKTINLGVGREIKIMDLTDEIISILGKPVKIVVDSERLRPEKSEVTRLLSDNRLAKELLGWTPQVSLQEGLFKTIEWISEHREYYHSLQYQI